MPRVNSNQSLIPSKNKGVELCSFCKEESSNIGWDETSHLGKRPICYTCIARRDSNRMHTHNCIILSLKEDGKLWNIANSLSFRVSKRTDHHTHTELTFISNKKEWVGIMYDDRSRVLCRLKKI